MVTSRNQLTGLVAAEGAHPLTAGPARRRRRRGSCWPAGSARPGRRRTGGRRARSSARCARLPLALAIVAARAATRPQPPLAALAAELRDAGDRLDALAGRRPGDRRAGGVLLVVPAPSARGAARLFRLLGLHPGPDISAAAAASLAGLPAPRGAPAAGRADPGAPARRARARPVRLPRPAARATPRELAARRTTPRPSGMPRMTGCSTTTWPERGPPPKSCSPRGRATRRASSHHTADEPIRDPQAAKAAGRRARDAGRDSARTPPHTAGPCTPSTCPPLCSGTSTAATTPTRWRARPRTSSAVLAMLCVASASGTSAGSAARASAVGTSSGGIASTPSIPGGGSKARLGAIGADHEAAEQRRRDVVGMALELGSEVEQRRVELVQVVGGRQPRHDRGGARAEATRQRDLRADAKREPVGGTEALESLDAEVRAVQRDALELALDGELPVSTTSSSSAGDSAAASASKPGPRLPDDAGTRTRRRRFTRPPRGPPARPRRDQAHRGQRRWHGRARSSGP